MKAGVAYIVELNNQSAPTYRAFDGEDWWWTTDINCAVKFADQESAEWILGGVCRAGEDAVVRDHEWVDKP